MENVSSVDRLAPKNDKIIQLYSAQTANGLKVAACLEELSLIKSVSGVAFEYEPHSVDIRHRENLKFLPNGKIPAILDPNGPGGKKVSLFESGAILMYLAEQYHELLPQDPLQRIETMKWLFWGSASVSGIFKQFGFYYKYCPHPMPYCVERYANEVKRLLGVLETHLHDDKLYIMGDMFTIADLSIWPWVYALHENYNDAITVSNLITP
jgi:GST-like protein